MQSIIRHNHSEMNEFSGLLRIIIYSALECSPNVDLNVICKQMGRSPEWMQDILLRADGYETDWYRKD